MMSIYPVAISSYTFRHHSRAIIRRMERSTTTLCQVQTMESDNPDGGLRLQRERGSAADRGDAVWSSRRPGKSCGPGGQDRHQQQRNGHRAFRVSDGGGLYRAVNFQPGVYTVTVTAPGFSIYVERGLQLTVAATRELASEVRISFSGRKTRKLKAPSIQSCSSLASLTLISILERALSMMCQEQIGFVRICTDASCSRKEQV